MMIRCPECRKLVSERASACPGCGFTFTPGVVLVQKAKRSQEELVALVVGGTVVVVMLVLCSGLLTSSASSSYSSRSSSLPSAVTSSPPASSSSWESLTSRIHYDDATDRHWKDLPSLRGYSDREKEEIITAAKKLTHAVDQLQRERGY